MESYLKLAFLLIDRDEDGLIDINDWNNLKSESFDLKICTDIDSKFDQVMDDEEKICLEEFVEKFKKLADCHTLNSYETSESDSSDSELEEEALEYLDESQKNDFLHAMENFFHQGS